MNNKLYISILIGVLLSLVACSGSKEDIDPNLPAPVVNFPIERLNIDLNKVDNLPVVAIIKSEVGLKKVVMKIETEEAVTEYKTVTEFFNPMSYSLSEKPEYDASYRAFIIEATDRLGHVVIKTLPFDVIGVVERPVVVFTPETIVYDEMDENPEIPRTTFKITSEAGLKSVEIFLVSANGQELKGRVDLGGEKEFAFDEMIDYKEGDRGFKIKAEDTYGYVTISTLPVTYRTIPGPELILPENVIFASTTAPKAVPMQIKSLRGLHGIVIYRIEEGTEVEAFRATKNGETTLDDAPEIEFTEATSRLKVVVTDGRPGKEAVGYIKAYVDMEVATVTIGSQPIANVPHEKYPDTYGMFSLNDMKTYSVDYAIVSEENGKNIDFKFYCFGGSAIPRLYSMDNTEKDKEFSGSTEKLSSIKLKTAMRFAILNSFDFEEATASSISKILSSNISLSKLTPFEVGDIIAFRTGKTSAAGGAKVGVMKVIGMTAPKELLQGNPTARVLTVEIKFPKKK